VDQHLHILSLENRLPVLSDRDQQHQELMHRILMVRKKERERERQTDRQRSGAWGKGNLEPPATPTGLAAKWITRYHSQHLLAPNENN
jgi:ferric-dicitrate binding protein FerR (iron transport regulator)